MESCTPFPRFLQDISVLSHSQSEKLAQILTNKEENTNISNLADFFGSLTPSDFYDLAVRLHSYWKKDGEVSPAKQESVTKLTNFVSKKLKHKGLTNIAFASSQPASAGSAKSVSFCASEGDLTNKTSKKYNSLIGNNIFNSLHKESQQRNYMHVENEHKKLSNETKDCTFQPQLIATRPISTSPVDVFERLQHDVRKEKESINEVIKIENETKECTFTPRINPKSLLSEESQEPSRMGTNQTFDRLYNQHHVKRYLSIDNEVKRQSIELKDCTFQPMLSTTRNGSVEAETDRHNKLYQLHSERQRSLMKKRMEKLEEEDQKCSFKPQVTSSAKKLTTKDVQDRLREWNEAKNIKMEIRLQEKKRTEEKRGLNLPAKKKNEAISPTDIGTRFNKLYKDNEDKKVRKEQLEKRIMKNIGASFTPKINVPRTMSARKDNEGLGVGYFLGTPQSATIPTFDDRLIQSSRKNSPVYKSSGKKLQEDENRTQVRKQFLSDLQKNLSGGFGTKIKAYASQ